MIQELLFENLRYIREENDLTQKDISEILNISQSNYSRWESKAKIIPLRKLNDLCNYFNVNMDYVVGISKTRKHMSNNNVLDKKVIGKNIKMFRIRNKLNQIDLAKLLNTTQSVISNYESGHTLILTTFAMEICMKYKMSLDELCSRK